ncbi:hypothetical protein [Desulfocurvus sp. DL9XJH121]
MPDIATQAGELTQQTIQAAQPVLASAHGVLQQAYALVQDLTPLLLVLLILLLVHNQRRLGVLMRRQEHQTRTLVKLLNLHPDSEHQKYLRLAEERAQERERRTAPNPFD